MRFNLLARRIAAPALGLALAATMAACSSSSSSPATAEPSSAASSAAPASSSAPSSAAASSPGTGSTAEAAAQIKANWEKFFNSSTPLAERVKLLQNGAALESAIKAFSSLPLASGIGAMVTNVTVDSATKATVTYNLTSPGGSALLSGQKGTAVYQDGTWKVGTGSLCGLLRLIPGGSVPAACNSAG
jgi:glucose/arabinose dehydrogenase